MTFARLVGSNVEQVPQECAELLQSADFSFTELDREGRDQCLLIILKRIFDYNIPPSGEKRQSQWEAGWRENLVAFRDHPSDFESLTPKYYRTTPAVRFSGRLVKPRSPIFEHNLFRLIRSFVTNTFLVNQPIAAIYEFGCGPCHNLAYLAGKMPNLPIVGLDWATSSQEIAKLLQVHHFNNVQGRHFDFFHPDHGSNLLPGSAVVTFGAFEQLGEGFKPMLDYLLKQEPAIVVNIEPVNEFYDPSGLLDYLGLAYHRKRNYLSGYYTTLSSLLAAGTIKTLHAHRVPVGGLFHEGWNILAWTA